MTVKKYTCQTTITDKDGVLSGVLRTCYKVDALLEKLHRIGLIFSFNNTDTAHRINKDGIIKTD